VCADSAALTAARSIPILHDGRVKSLDVFAREMMRSLTTKDTFQKRGALDVFLRHALNAGDVVNLPLIRVDHLELKKILGLSAGKEYFSYNDVKDVYSVVLNLARSADAKRKADQRPMVIEQKAEDLMSRIHTVDKLAAGDVWTVIPGEKGQAWRSPFGGQDKLSREFLQLLGFYAEGKTAEVIAAVESWNAAVHPSLSPREVRAIRLENFYYPLKPFVWALMFYLAAFVLLLFPQNAWLRGAGLVSAAGGFVFHMAGLLIRCFILGRPPVSNMYESMIFMTWVLMLCAVIYFAINRKDFILRAGLLAGGLVMVYADLLPIESSMGVLVPVLRSNYWLAIHVMTIVASYGIFGLAMGLGHRQLFLSSMGQMNSQEEKHSAHVIDRLIQTGVIVLGIGTVLGGVWANESWGRFWGWDPKETWAFITFLGYIVIVHLRARGKLSHFGLAAGSVIGFLLVLMTWYGVNFLLGRGLHSYGSGSGGVQWIVYFLIFEAVFSVFITVKRLKLV